MREKPPHLPRALLLRLHALSKYFQLDWYLNRLISVGCLEPQARNTSVQQVLLLKYTEFL